MSPRNNPGIAVKPSFADLHLLVDQVSALDSRPGPGTRERGQMRVVTMQAEELQLLRVIAATLESEYGLVVCVEGSWTVTA